ncbi:MAG: site-2 protease family protein [Pirellulales bacterium]|nr:site-2 protease family protein [Pirellulales bacterium]
MKIARKDSRLEKPSSDPSAAVSPEQPVGTGKLPVASEIPPVPKERVLLPAVLFLATCLSTFWTGAVGWRPFAHLDSFERAWGIFWQNLPQSFGGALRVAATALDWDWSQGLVYMAAVLAILLTHEMGHFLIALRYGVPASLPYFIPVPVLPFGTMGAIIEMEEGSQANRRQMFDLGLIGPLAGLVVAIPITIVGIYHLPKVPLKGEGFLFDNPLLIRYLIDFLRPDYASSTKFYLNQFNPYLMAGWVGMFVTGLNMLPVSQLDGGHVAYSLLERGAHTLARGLLVFAILYVLYTEQYGWVVMLVIVILLGIDHPPTADDGIEIGPVRRALGWLALLIPILCLSPIGISQPVR